MNNTYTQVPSEPIIVASAVSLVDVVAPSDLESGYTFNAIYDGVTFQVKVPEGGVSKGQTFSVPFAGGTAKGGGSSSNNNEAPHGVWKDGVFSCLRYGIFHATFWHCFFCPQLLTAQVMTRMHLNWKADEGTEEERKTTYKKVSIIVAIYWIAHFLFGSVDDDGVPSGITEFAPLFIILSMQFISCIFFIYTMVIITKTRKAVRQRYDIPEEYCHGCEDFCCALWCGNCISAQMARHTTDYEAQRGVCCTDNGLPPTYHVMIV